MSVDRELVAFTAAVQCTRADGAVNLVLAGDATELLFEGATAVSVPAQLRGARVLEIADLSGDGVHAARRRFRIEAAGVNIELQARAVQVHRDASAEFFRALPPPHVPLRVRLGWWLLLSLLRVPGAAALLRRIRG
ncbi:MAG: hypothetical protein ACRESY_05805, partial [Steroidobacteraceae bacterium]